MASIQTTDARGLFTKALSAVYRERPRPTGFLRSFFTEKEHRTLEIAIAVQRGTEKVAVDVVRGTRGNRNESSKSTEKIFIPPYYSEYFDHTSLDLYDRLFSSESIEEGVFVDFVNQVADQYQMLMDKIDRAYEVQASQVLEDGIVQLAKATNIDFNRDTLSKVDLGSGNYWNQSINPITSIITGCQRIRQKGKSQGGVFNLLLGSNAKEALFNNTSFQAQADVRRFELVDLRMPQRNSVGGTTHGAFSAGDYKIIVWTYPEYYDNAAGVSTPYLNTKKAILLPEAPNFQLSYGAVPTLLDGNPVPTQGKFVMSDYVDVESEAHIYKMKSAGVAIPVAVDQIYTMQVLA